MARHQKDGKTYRFLCTLGRIFWKGRRVVRRLRYRARKFWYDSEWYSSGDSYVEYYTAVDSITSVTGSRIHLLAGSLDSGDVCTSPPLWERDSIHVGIELIALAPQIEVFRWSVTRTVKKLLIHRLEKKNSVTSMRSYNPYGKKFISRLWRRVRITCHRAVFQPNTTTVCAHVYRWISSHRI